MKRKEISDKARLFRGLFLFLGMLAVGTIVDCIDHTTPKSWLMHTVTPVTVGFGVVFVCFYVAIKLKQKILSMPEEH